LTDFRNFFTAILLYIEIEARTDGQMDNETEGRTDGQTQS